MTKLEKYIKNKSRESNKTNSPPLPLAKVSATPCTILHKAIIGEDTVKATRGCMMRLVAEKKQYNYKKVLVTWLMRRLLNTRR